VEEIRKKYGEGAIIRGDTVVKGIEAIPSGSLKLDIALGVGGFPRGRICEIFGAEGSGKTTLALSAIAQAQRLGGSAAFVDVEHALDMGYARDIGVNTKTIMLSQPDSGEEAMAIVEILCKSNTVDIVVVDSVAALVPQAELDGEIGDSHVGAQARLMSQSLRKIKGIVNKSETGLLFINQIREKVGVFFGNPEVTPGGRALKFFASVRVDLRRISAIGAKKDKDNREDKSVSIGNVVRANVIKNKVAPPFRKAEFEIYFGKGISETSDILDLAIDCGIVQKAGSWINYNDLRLGLGKQAAMETLDKDPDLIHNLKDMILNLKLPIRKGKKDGTDTCAEVEHQ